MPARDRVAEIAEVKRRGPKAAEGFSREFEILQKQWARIRKTDGTTDDFFLIRAVTLIEVFTRGWVAQLIDHGSPFVERAAGLKIDFKFDFGSVRAIHGRVITMGDVVAHVVPLNRFGQVLDIFGDLLAAKLLPLISKAVHTPHGLAELLLCAGEPGSLIVKDADGMSAQLSSLFETRHILCHEFPQKEVYDREDISGFLDAASQFALATNEVLSGLLRGDAPTTLKGLIIQAKLALEGSELLLADVVSRLDDGRNRKRLRMLERANKQWLAFRDTHAAYRSLLGGPAVAEWLRLRAANQLTRSRIDDLVSELRKTMNRSSPDPPGAPACGPFAGDRIDFPVGPVANVTVGTKGESRVANTDEGNHRGGNRRF